MKKVITLAAAGITLALCGCTAGGFNPSDANNATPSPSGPSGANDAPQLPIVAGAPVR